jgi:hypothetical protein
MANTPISRRSLLEGVGLALSAKGLSAADTSAAAPLPKVRLGDREITRLIVGANPFGGYSHFNRLLDAHMKEWMTLDRVVETLHRCEQNGINAWEFHYGAETLAALNRHRADGGKLQAIVLSEGPLKTDLTLIPEVAKLKPVGIVHHGGVTDQRFRSGEMDKVQDYLKRVRDSGVMVGLSMHNPLVMDYVEERNWDIDFYMTCLHQISRTPEETRKLLGALPLGEPFLEEDRVRMCSFIRRTRKTCLAFKVLGAGRLIGSPAEVQRAFGFVFDNIKPQDAVIVGMYPRFKDEVAENAALVRRFGTRPAVG